MSAPSQKQLFTALLSQHGLTPNRALGQNFLIDETAVQTIIDSAQIEQKAVLEIGPGLGALTEPLLSRASRVAAVEIDRSMADILCERFGDRLLLYREDFLKSDIPALRAALGGGSFCVVANLPYYITTPICMRLLESGAEIESMTLMVQEEAAQRFFARCGERVYGPLSVLTQAYYDVTPILSLTPGSYYPQPDVCSRVVRLSRNAQPCVGALPRLLRAAFQMRRKTLLNNLKAVCPDPVMIRQALEACGLCADTRAEALTAQDFIRLAQALL